MIGDLIIGLILIGISNILGGIQNNSPRIITLINPAGFIYSIIAFTLLGYNWGILRCIEFSKNKLEFESLIFVSPHTPLWILIGGAVFYVIMQLVLLKIEKSKNNNQPIIFSIQ